MTEAAASLSTLLGHRSFAYFWFGRTATVAAYQMLTVAVGWQIYDMTGSALDLGLVGLVQFVPVIPMSLVIGQVADYFDRRSVVRTVQIIKALAAAALAIGTAAGWLNRDAILAILLVIGAARSFETPTLLAMVPGLVPPAILPRAIAASGAANQTATICGPALGGAIYAFGPTTVYALCTATFVAASVLVSLIERVPHAGERQPISLSSLFAGFDYIWHRQIVLGAISLDLFAVLLGAVISIMPIYARDILGTGPWGLGLLRTAPALGAFASSVLLTSISLERRLGTLMFSSVMVYALAIGVFAVSTSLVLSMLALAVYGAVDALSVVIRQVLVQTRTPQQMLGRVTAINTMCSGTANTLGEFKAGVLAAWLGVVPAALLGAGGALAVALLWMQMFPELRRVNSLAAER